MLVIEDLDEAMSSVLARGNREHAAARQLRPELPALRRCRVLHAALQRLRDSGHHGLVATGDGRTVAVMTATVRQHPVGGRYARLPAKDSPSTQTSPIRRGFSPPYSGTSRRR